MAGKTHRESYYQEGGVEHEATFAIFPSGYMDGELGLEYMQQHFEPYTRGAVRRGEAEGVVEGVAEEIDHEMIPPRGVLL